MTEAFSTCIVIMISYQLSRKTPPTIDEVAIARKLTEVGLQYNCSSFVPMSETIGSRRKNGADI